jgi:hypothetical protein
LAIVHRELIVMLAARHKAARGLFPTTLRHPRRPDLLRGPNFVDQYRRAAGYVDRDASEPQSISRVYHPTCLARAGLEEILMLHKVATAVAALLAGTVWVAAQGTQKEVPSAPGAQTQAPGAQPSQKGEPKGQKNGVSKEADPKAAPKAAEPKADPKAAPKAAEPKADPKAEPSAGATTTITTEQRTQVRQTIIKESNAPRVTNVNFSLNVGTVVPRTVTIVVLPMTVVEIYPAWRGYHYFIVGERIVIVEPDTLRIVFIIDA